MSNNRSWTWREEAAVSEEQIAIRTPAIEDLVRRWNRLQNEAEERGFKLQAAYETGEYDEPDFETDEEMQGFELRRRVARELEDAELEAIEIKLRGLGVRIMRPYEHWNEDEQLMAYLERER
jgi:hypothetical protein